MSSFIKPNRKDHFNYFINLLNSTKPFSFIRFSDGEVEVLDVKLNNRKTKK